MLLNSGALKLFLSDVQLRPHLLMMMPRLQIALDQFVESHFRFVIRSFAQGLSSCFQLHFQSTDGRIIGNQPLCQEALQRGDDEAVGEVAFRVHLQRQSKPLRGGNQFLRVSAGSLGIQQERTAAMAALEAHQVAVGGLPAVEKTDGFDSAHQGTRQGGLSAGKEQQETRIGILRSPEVEQPQAPAIGVASLYGLLLRQ